MPTPFLRSERQSMPRIKFPDKRLVLSFAAVSFAAVASVRTTQAAAIDHTTATYLTYCGGCHGIDGRAPHTFVPDLSDRVGRFLCSPEGRAYVVRVPGVSMSMIRSDADLADVLNLVMTRMAGKSLPADARPFTAKEVHALRAEPLRTTELMAYRAGVLQRAVAQCPTAAHSAVPN